ncbi:alpha/beta hydrolase [Leucobacter weissii]|uniref:Alpha/beta hydrolase n=1 Tax=Leucobacter weissii TaxID=1983706 RepID=A0A939SCP8_9MICO|nr:alpha/beta hydrolase [Leucobacter weissii]MBO1902578.1 alpha/beta hydrolase [Leucobacter weissii]
MTAAPPDLVIETLGIGTRTWQYGDPDGSVLVLVHGFRGDHHGLEKLASAIAARRPGLKVLVPDLPGFGATPAVPGRPHDLELYGEWLRLFAARAAPGSTGVLGHSFGSLVVANALAGGLDPDSVILVNPISSPALEGPQALLTALATLYYRAAEALPERAARGLLGHPLIVRAMSAVMAKTGDRELRAWIHDQHGRYFSSFADTTTLLEAFRASVSHTVGEYAASLPAETLLIAGDRDDITPLTAQLDLQHRVPGSRLRIAPGVGHLIHYEAAEDAADEITVFLRAGSGGAG